MNITKLDIELDKDISTYEPGEEISGQVSMRLENPEFVRGLKIKAEGRCDVQWVKNRINDERSGLTKAHPVIVSGSENYIYRMEYLIGHKNGPQIKLPAGEQSYPFSFRLPRKIPSSFRDVYGCVKYFLKAVVHFPYRDDHEVTKRFTVISKLDLNTVNRAGNEIHDERTLSFCNYFCCSLGEMDVQVRVPVRGYVPGQTIRAKIYFDNRSEAEFKKIKLDFIQVMTYKVPSDNEEMVINKILENKTVRGRFEPCGEFDMNILVESVPVSFLPFCNLIDIDYKLSVTYVVHNTNISNNYQIAIGTIPLRSTQSNWSRASVPVESTEPIAPYPPEPEVPVAPYPPKPKLPNAPYPPEPEVTIAPYPPAPEVPIAPYPSGPEVPNAPYPPEPDVTYPSGPEVPNAPYPPEPDVTYPPAPEVPIAPYPSGPEVPNAPYPPEPDVTYPSGPEVPNAPYPPGPADRAMPINRQPMPQNHKLGFDNYKPRAGEPVNGIPFVPVPGPSTLPIGFVVPPEFPPPSYEDCTRESHPVDQEEEPNSGADVKQPLMPPYPLDNLPYKRN